MNQPEIDKMVDEFMADFGDEAIKIGKDPKGFYPMVNFVNKKIDEKYAAKLLAEAIPSVPASSEMMVLRGMIEVDMTERLANGTTTFDREWNNPEVRAEFNNNYQIFNAYKEAISSGRARWIGSKTIGRANND